MNCIFTDGRDFHKRFITNHSFTTEEALELLGYTIDCNADSPTCGELLDENGNSIYVMIDDIVMLCEGDDGWDEILAKIPED